MSTAPFKRAFTSKINPDLAKGKLAYGSITLKIITLFIESF